MIDSHDLSVCMRGISKRFPGVVANDCVDFDARRGEIHTLLGENGAGKSTLMNILSGLYRPDEGQILIGGGPVAIRSPRDALRYGIGMVHQHFMLVERHTVTENIILGLRDVPFFYTRSLMEERIRGLSGKYGLRVEPRAGIWDLSVGEQQKVEILKMLLRRVDILILDEPTAVLTPDEAAELFLTVRGIAAEGKTVIFISHKLSEVMEISHRITILRKGKRVATLRSSETDGKELARLMMGQDISVPPPVGKKPGRKHVLEVRKLDAYNERFLPAVKGIDLTVHEGEILGIAGVSGNGQKEIEEILSGLRKPAGGQVILQGEDVTGASPRRLSEKGIACIPADRSRVGTASGLGAVDNLVLKTYRRPPLSAGILLRKKAAKARAGELIRQYRIAVPDLDAPVRLLSGGNIQKIILAREMCSLPRFLLAVHPTRGLDVGASDYVQRSLMRMKEEGVGILLISEDIEELLVLSDRIAVIYGGRIMGVLSKEDATRERIGLLMTGQKP